MQSMIKLLVGSIIVCVACMSICSLAAEGSPAIAFDTTKIDLGLLRQGEKGKAEFIISNQGDAKLYLKQVRGSCGCTSVSLEQKELAPGEKTRLTAIIDTSGESTAFTKSIHLESNDPNREKAVLYLSGLVFSPLNIRPNQVNFGLRQTNSPTTRTVVITAYTDPPMDIREFEVQENESVTAEIISTNSFPPASESNPTTMTAVESTLLVTLSGSVRTGAIHGEIVLQTNLREYPELRIPIIGNKIGPIRCKPAVLYLGSVRARAVIEKSVDLNAVDKRPFSIRAVEGDGVQCEWNTDATSRSAQTSIVCRITIPQGRATALKGNLKIQTDHPEHETVLLPVVARIESEDTAETRQER